MSIERRAAIGACWRNARATMFIVPGLGSTTWDLAPLGDNDRNFYLWGAMGGAAMIGLGLALAQPDKRIAVITGDGEMLMGLGALATIGVKRPPNLAVIVFDNGVYGETGMQPSHTARRRRPARGRRALAASRSVSTCRRRGRNWTPWRTAGRTMNEHAICPGSDCGGRSTARAAGA